MEEYLEKVLLQIRCKKARPFVEEELRNHMEDQISDNMAAGMSREQAEASAVRDMGDPVETGISLDRVHRPQAAWRLLFLVAVISILAVAVHGLICVRMDGHDMALYYKNSGEFAGNVLIGIAVMFLIYFIDYTVIARFAKIIAAVILGICLMGGVFGIQINGITYYIRNVRFSIFALMMLYIPIYGAVLYKYHNTGYRGLAKAVLWLILPVFAAFRLPSVMLAAVLLVSMLVQLTIAVAKGWFRVPKKKVTAVLWMFGIMLPALSLAFLYGFHILAEYQRERLQAFLTNSGDANYMTGVLRELTESSRLVGSSGREVIGIIPDFNSDYIFTYLTASYGILAGAAVLCILAAVIFMVFGASIRQKNELGLVMGCGCGMVFLLNTAVNVMENVGFLPLSQTFLPFVSAGGSCIVMSYALIGLTLGIYRYKNVYPSHVESRLAKIKLTIEL